MDINDFNSKYENEGYENLQRYVFEETDLLQEYLYIFKILDAVKKAENLDFNFFCDNGVKYIKLWQYHDYEIGNILKYALFDKNDHPTERYRQDGKYLSFSYEAIENIIDSYHFQLKDDCFSSIIKNNEVKFVLNDTFPQKLKEVCLNDKLLKIVQYLDLSKNIKENNSDIKQKIKL